MLSLFWLNISDVDEQVEKQDASDEDDLEPNCKMELCTYVIGRWASLCKKVMILLIQGIHFIHFNI